MAATTVKFWTRRWTWSTSCPTTCTAHGPREVGHHAPLFRGPFGQVSGQSVSAVVKAWEHLGVSKHKLVVGLPMYGRGWILGNSTSRGLGAAATDPIGTSNYTEKTVPGRSMRSAKE